MPSVHCNCATPSHSDRDKFSETKAQRHSYDPRYTPSLWNSPSWLSPVSYGATHPLFFASSHPIHIDNPPSPLPPPALIKPCSRRPLRLRPRILNGHTALPAFLRCQPAINALFNHCLVIQPASISSADSQFLTRVSHGVELALEFEALGGAEFILEELPCTVDRPMA